MSYSGLVTIVTASVIDHIDLAGFIVNWILFGALSVQVYNYHLGFPNDKRFIKAMVYGVYLIEIFQTGLTINEAFSFTENNRTPWLTIRLIPVRGPIISAIVAFIGQIFYAFRIYVLSSSKLVSSVIALIALLQCMAGIADGVTTYIASMNPQFGVLRGVPILFWYFSSGVCDLMIAGYMTYFLRHHNTTGHKPTQLLVKRIIRLTVETGILTATLQIALIISVFTFPYTGSLGMTMSKWYSNTILLMLNSRLRIIDDVINSDDVSRQGSIWFRRSELSSSDMQTVQHGASLVRSIIDTRRTSDENIFVGHAVPPKSTPDRRSMDPSTSRKKVSMPMGAV